MSDANTQHVCGMPWFEARQEIDLFRELEYACVYALGPAEGAPLRIGMTADPRRELGILQAENWQDLIAHEIVWTAGKPLARRLKAEVHRLLDGEGRRIRADWFRLERDEAWPLIKTAAATLKIPTFSHQEMMRRVRSLREDRIAQALASAGFSHLHSH